MLHPRNPPKQKNSDSSASRGTNSNWDFGLSWICIVKFEILDLVNFRGAAFSVESVMTLIQHTNHNIHSCNTHWVVTRPHYAALQHAATRCNTLQHAATRCNTHTATHCSTHLKCVSRISLWPAQHMIHGGKCVWDALSCRSLSAKEPLFRIHRVLFRYIGLFSGYIGLQPSKHMMHGEEYVWDTFSCRSFPAKELLLQMHGSLFQIHRALFWIYRVSTISWTHDTWWRIHMGCLDLHLSFSKRATFSGT